MEVLEKVQQLKAELDSLRPLNAEAEARIMQKFRLDWNYHSNHLEGNSLTFGETKALILFDKAIGDKNFKDYDEMRDHNFVIKYIEKSSKDKTELTEKFIREIHVLLLKKDHFKEAQTSNGEKTRRKIEVGKYKTLPNHVLLPNDEIFYFAPPEETPAKMRELIDWYRKEREKSNSNPIVLATLFHHHFVKIHPFDDGNGRTARILMNFILMQYGFPPVIVQTEDKDNYYGVLRLADIGEFEPFIEYIANNLLHSLKIMIKGAKGENIEEPNDLDKELALLKHKVRNIGRTVEISKNKDVLLEIFEQSMEPLIHRFLEVCGKFDDFYLKTRFLLFSGGGATNLPPKEAIANAKSQISDQGGVSDISLEYIFTNFRQTGYNDFDFHSRVYIKFEFSKYKVFLEEELRVYEKLYSEQLEPKETEEIVKTLANLHKEFIENKLEEKIINQKRLNALKNWAEETND